GEVGAALRRGNDDPARLRRAGAELAGERPIAADVRRRDPQIDLGAGVDLVHAAQLVDAVDHEPLDTPGRGGGDGFARFHRVRITDVLRLDPEGEQQVELRGRGDL